MWLPDGAGKFLTYDSDRDSEPSRSRAPKRMLPMPPLPSQDVAAVVDEHGQPTGISSDIMVNRQENAIANADFQGTSQGNDTVDGLEPLPVPVTDTVAAPDASDRKPLTPLEKFQLFEAGKSAEKDIKSTGECITGSVNKSEKEQENSGEPKSLPVGDSGSSTTGVATLDNSKSADASVAVPAGSAAVPPRSHKVSTDWETFESIANRNNNLAIPAGCSKSKSESNFKAADGNTMTDPVFKLSTIVPELPRSDSVDKQKTVVVKEGTAGTGVDEVDTGMTVPVPNKANAGNQLTNEVTADQTERPTSPTPDTQVPEWVKNQATWKNNDIDRLDQVEAALSLPDSEMERETATLFMRTWDKEMAKRRTSDEICIAELEGLAKRSVVDNSPQERVAGEPDSHVYPWGSGGVAADKTNEAVEREKVDGPKSESTPGTSTQIPTATSESFPTIPSPATNSDKKVPTTSSPWNGTDTTDGVPSKATPACEAPSTATSSAPGSPGYLAADKSVMLTENEPQAHIPPSDKALAHESKDRNATFLVKQTEAAGVSSDQLCHRVECPVQTPTDSPENEGELVWVRTISATVPADTGNINLSTPHEVGDLPTMRLGPDHVDLPKARTLSENNTKTDGHDETDHGGSLTADGTARTSGTDGDTLSKEEMLTKTTLGGGRNSMNIGGTESSSDLQEGLTLDSDKTTEPSTPSTSDTAVPSEEHLIPATSADGDELLVTHTKSVRLGRTAPNGPKATVDDQRRELFQLSRAQNEANEAKSLGVMKTGQDQIDSSAPYNLDSVAKVEGHSATTEPKLKRQKKTTTTSVDAENSDSDNAALIGSATSSGHGKDSTSFDGDCDSDLSSPTDLRVNPSAATETTPLNPTKAAKLHDKEEETVWAIDMEAMENYKKVLEVHLAQNDSGDKGGATVCFFACYLPARSTPRYEFLMQNIFRYFTSTLDLLADHQCTLIYFNGAVPAAIYPSTSWLHQCYKMIDRRMQKNLQDLIIVHPNFWLKAQLQTIGRAFLRLESLRGSLGMTEGEFERLDVPSCIREDEAKWNTAKAVSDTNTASRFALLRKCSF
ncbi:putative BCL2/adenovirus E1B 19 kDa protein-interacting protein 2 [Hypsibius exemplaris]|uniref:BCL2/adenovirus E1B 19 kDa protein-interacting protein 2 n=1 Tax=Hypsibius exemplaris TaxID=2072580 RepID=A0A1W0WQR0_HYPEX|nr:putative BCL2/adenovirus E1B 19 kDa protein-interacting protein 2 [Hypsibius exemplaris]